MNAALDIARLVFCGALLVNVIAGAAYMAVKALRGEAMQARAAVILYLLAYLFVASFATVLKGAIR